MRVATNDITRNDITLIASFGGPGSGFGGPGGGFQCGASGKPLLLQRKPPPAPPKPPPGPPKLAIKVISLGVISLVATLILEKSPRWARLL